MGEASNDRRDGRRSVGLSMQRTKPPFRADHVGSLLRPAALKEARDKHAKGEIGDAELKAVEEGYEEEEEEEEEESEDGDYY